MAPDDKADSHDASRREFFRTFSRQTVQGAGALVGAATELRRTSAAAARELLAPSFAETIVENPPVLAGDPGAPEWSFRSPYRFTADALILLDQRDLPARVSTISVTHPSEVASSMRAGVVGGGPVMGEIAAYAMVLAAAAASGGTAAGRRQMIGAAAGTLRSARRDIQAVVSSVDAVEARYHALVDEDADNVLLIELLRDAADAAAANAAAAHAAIARRAAAQIGRNATSPIQLLFHGDTGPLSCGLVGMGTSLIAELTDAGHTVHTWVTEARPTDEGSRITSLQLTQNDLAHTVIPDSAVAWLLSSRSINAVVLRGDRVCANGDTGTLIGSLNVAELAVSHDVPVYVLAPMSSLDRTAAEGHAIRAHLSSSAEVLSERRAQEGSDVGSPFAVRLRPQTDVLPAALIKGLVTEAGMLTAPYSSSFAGAVGT
jgi:methylthioribose-1-phosphate isomerase